MTTRCLEIKNFQNREPLIVIVQCRDADGAFYMGGVNNGHGLEMGVQMCGVREWHVISRTDSSLKNQLDEMDENGNDFKVSLVMRK